MIDPTTIAAMIAFTSSGGNPLAKATTKATTAAANNE
jgi:hypothetical protein